MQRFLLIFAFLTAALGMNAQTNQQRTTAAEEDKQFVEVYAYYPDALAAFKWSVYINPEEDEEFLAAYVLDSIDGLDPNTTIDGHMDGFVNEITVNAPDGVEYSGEMIGGGYWMYNLNDEMAQLGVMSQPVVAGDVIFWEYKTDWTSWDITTVDDMFAVDDLYFEDFGFVNTPIGETIDTVIIACDSINFNGEWYYQSGSYTIHNGSITYNLDLTVNHSQTEDIYETACGSYVWGGTTYTHSGVYHFNGTSINGCDSIVTLHLTINKAQEIELQESACESYEWNGQTYTESGDYIFEGTSVAGCDSTVTLHLTINHNTEEEIYETAQESYTWEGTTYTQSGTYQFNGTSINGCDSVVILHLTIESTALPNNNINARLYPNPTTDQLHIEASGATNIYIYDATGRLVMEAPYEETVEVSQLANGMYLLRVSTADGQSATEHFLKQ